jgi:hypothetical protein
LKHEIFRKAFAIAANLLVQAPCFHLVEYRQVFVKHDLLPTDMKYPRLDVLYRRNQLFGNYLFAWHYHSPFVRHSTQLPVATMQSPMDKEKETQCKDYGLGTGVIFSIPVMGLIIPI